MLVDTVHAETMEHVERPHPFGVSFGEVVVDRDHMHALACKRVEEYGKGCHEGLSFTGRHFSDLSFVQGDTADELHIVMHHVPRDLVAAGNPFVVEDCLVAVDGHEIVGSGQGAVKIVGDDCNGLVLGQPARG